MLALHLVLLTTMLMVVLCATILFKNTVLDGIPFTDLRNVPAASGVAFGTLFLLLGVAATT